MAIAELLIGADKTNPQYRFTQRQIVSVNGNVALSIVSTELSYDEIVIEVNTRSGISVPYGTPAFYYTHDNLVGKFYVKVVDQVDAYVYDITLISAIGLLDRMSHYGGLYINQYLSTVLEDILSINVQGAIPSGYTELEYITDNGSCAIYTDITLTEGSRVVTDVMYNGFPITQMAFGSLYQYRSYGVGIANRNSIPTAFTMLNDGYGTNPESNGVYLNFTPQTGIKYHIDYNYFTEGSQGSGNLNHKTEYNGEIATNTTLGMVDPSYYKLAIGGTCVNSTNMNFNHMLYGRLYEMYVYDASGVLVGHFVPVKNPSNVVGMFDVVSQTFYTNAETRYGSHFTAGPETGGGTRTTVIDYTVDPSIQNLMVNGYLPIGTKRSNLHQLLFAYGLSVRKDTNGDVFFSVLSDVGAIPIESGRYVYMGGSKTSNNSAASRVEVTEHAYVYDATQTRKDLYSSQGQAVTNKYVEFEEAPVYVNSLVADGLTIVKAGVNYAIVTGNGSLTGIPYVHYQTVIGKDNESAYTERVVRANSSFTLVSVVNSNALLEHLFNYYAYGKIIRNSMVLTDQHVGGKYSFVDPFRRNTTAFLASMAITGSAKVKADCELVTDYVPINMNSVYSHFQVLTSSGYFSTPQVARDNGRMTVVLIGGGSGGQSGLGGKHSGASDGHIYTADSEDPSTSYGASGGLGGEGGHGGNGGRILQVTINNPTSSYYYSCGAGGSGGSQTESETTYNNGSDGSDTTFGSWSTANGSLMPSGYMNPFNGTVYGKKGLDGVAGGSGGRMTIGMDDYGNEIYSSAGESVKFNGVVYNGGSPGTNLGDKYSDYYVVYGGPGAGAAVGTPGHDGGNAYSSGSGWIVNYFAGSGYNGSTPVDADDGYTRGSGGNGGHGGGGAAGGGNILRMLNDVIPSAYVGTKGSPGFGGKGGDGSNGCVIVFY